MKATELLQKQHREIEELLARLGEAGAEEQKGVRAELASLLVAHSTIEEEIFYPALRQAAPELVLEAMEEHGLADYELGRSFSARQGEALARARAVVLGDVLRAHIRKEESVIFRRAEAEITNQELAEIGETMAARFEHLRKGDAQRILARSLAEDAPRLTVRKAKPTRGAKKAARSSAAQRSAPKRATPKRSTTKRPASKRSTTKRPASKRATPKRAAAQRAMPKRSPTKRAASQKSGAARKGKSSQSRAARS